MHRNLYAKTGNGFLPKFVALNVENGKLGLIVRSDSAPSGDGATAQVELSGNEARDIAFALLGYGVGENKQLAPEGMPRRIRVDLATPAEAAIRDAMFAVERAGGSVLLTDAINLLSFALDRVADHVEAGVR